MKPPEDNIWIETSAGEGKVYYYNSKTRETSWNRPENAVIMTQEQMAAAYRPPLLPTVGGQRPLWPQPGVMANVPGQLPFGLAPSPARLPITPMSIGNAGLLRPPFGPPGLLAQPGQPGSRLPLPNPTGSALLPTPNQPASVLPSHPMSLPIPQLTVPGPLVAPSLAPGTAPNASAVPHPAFEPNRTLLLHLVDNDIKSRALEWISHKTPDGKVYYFSTKQNKSVWEKPQALIDLDDALEKAKQTLEQQRQTSQQQQQEVRNASDLTHLESKDDANGMQQSVNQQHILAQQQTQLQQQQQQQQQQQPEQPKDKSKPVSSHPVTGTPWCIVWTGDERVFFYNPSTKTSVWEKPPELKNRPDVDKLLKAPPTKEASCSPSEGNSNNNTHSQQQEANGQASNVNSEKRAITDDADDDNCKSSKKAKKSDSESDVKKEADAELIAAKQRETLPLEERVEMFKGLLAEKEVSAFSTWEKELHKIVFDPRYLLLTSKERKVVFDEYVKDRAEKERQEKRNAYRKARDDFKKLLQEAKLTSRVTFSEFCQKFSRDERFKRIDKMRERESYFNDFMLELRRKEREEKSTAKEKARRDFNDLLRERHDKSPFDSRTRWSDVRDYIRDDPRYRGIDSSSEKEDLFRSFVSQVVSNFDRSSSSNSRAVVTSDDGQNGGKGDSTKEPGEIDESFREKEKEREKRERIEASLREREREVAKELSTHLRERDKELEKHKRSEAVETFIAMLIDMIKSDDYTWREARKVLKKDRRCDWVDILTREEKETLFNEHIEKLLKKKKEKFRECLSEVKDLTLTSSWRDVRRQIKEDPRYIKFSTSDRKCEREFKEYLHDKLLEAKNEFREFLKETKILTYKSKKLIEESDQHLQDIISVLQNDKRYLVLDCVEDERREILMNYVDELARKGPPPPPTASEPSSKRQK